MSPGQAIFLTEIIKMLGGYVLAQQPEMKTKFEATTNIMQEFIRQGRDPTVEEIRAIIDEAHAFNETILKSLQK